MTTPSAADLPTAGASIPAAGAPRVRIAPSPTGDPHVGTAYMALFNRAFARAKGGAFVLRIEDTDRARFDATSEQQLFDTLHWLNLGWDEGPDVGGPHAPYRQSERLETYRPYVDKLLAGGHAYHCWCTPERLAQMREMQQKLKQPTGYDRLCYGKSEAERAELPGFSAKPVVRMYIPEDAPTSFTDLIRGQVSAPRPDDQVILKTDGFPTYHLAVVVDDHEMGITHVVRGEEWISSTPKHLLLYRWLDLPEPVYAHMPLLRNVDKSKISKRKNPAARLTWFKEEGYLPEALVNFLALLAYPPATDAEGNDLEKFTFDEFAARFSFDHVNPAGPIFDTKKLDWLNGVYLRDMEAGEVASRLLPYLQAEGVIGDNPSMSELARIAEVVPLIQTRMNRLTEAGSLIKPFLVADAELSIDPQARAALDDQAAAVLDAGIATLTALPVGEGLVPAERKGDFVAEKIEAALRAAIVEGMGLKPKVAFTPLRVAISGARISPPLFESMEILGKDSTLRRLHALRQSIAG